jgi:hypothetical protein
MAKKLTQGDRIAWHLKRAPMTYLQMNMLCLSVSPHRRAADWLASHPGWMLRKGKDEFDRTTWRIVRNRKPR